MLAPNASERDHLRFLACGCRRRRQVHADRAADGRDRIDPGRPDGEPDQSVAEIRHHRRQSRLRAAARRPRGRARARHHHRRRLSLFRDAEARLHRGRHAGPRAIHPQHGDRRVECRIRAAAGRCARQASPTDAASQPHPVAAWHPARAACRQQDGPGRLRGSAVCGDPRRIQKIRRETFIRSCRGDPDHCRATATISSKRARAWPGTQGRRCCSIWRRCRSAGICASSRRASMSSRWCAPTVAPVVMPVMSPPEPSARATGSWWRGRAAPPPSAEFMFIRRKSKTSKPDRPQHSNSPIRSMSDAATCSLPPTRGPKSPISSLPMWCG